MSDHPTFKLEGGIGGVVSIGPCEVARPRTMRAMSVFSSVQPQAMA